LQVTDILAMMLVYKLRPEPKCGQIDPEHCCHASLFKEPTRAVAVKAPSVKLQLRKTPTWREQAILHTLKLLDHLDQLCAPFVRSVLPLFFAPCQVVGMSAALCALTSDIAVVLIVLGGWLPNVAQMSPLRKTIRKMMMHQPNCPAAKIRMECAKKTFITASFQEGDGSNA